MEYLAVFIAELLGLFFLSQLVTRSLSTFFFQVTKSKHATVQLLSFLFLPGVIVHELAHMLVASILFVPVGEIEFMPKLVGDSVKLGSVSIAKTDPLRRALIGFAPVFLGLVIILGSLFYFSPSVSSWLIVVLLYVLFEVGNTMFSSKKDMEGTLEVLVVVFLFLVLGYVLGIRIDISLVQKLFSKEVVAFFTKADVLLSLPIVIDCVIWGGQNLLAVLNPGDGGKVSADTASACNNSDQTYNKRG